MIKGSGFSGTYPFTVDGKIPYNKNASDFNIETILHESFDAAHEGRIDNIDNLHSKAIWILAGTDDHVIPMDIQLKTYQLWKDKFKSDVYWDNKTNIGHSLPEWAAENMIKRIYGWDLKSPTEEMNGEILTFWQ